LLRCNPIPVAETAIGERAAAESHGIQETGDITGGNILILKSARSRVGYFCRNSTNITAMNNASPQAKIIKFVWTEGLPR